jgi:hypothetical protein
MNLPGLRYANIGIAVAVVILVVGAILLKNAGEGALQGLCLGAFISCFAVYGFLDERARRRSKRSQ